MDNKERIAGLLNANEGMIDDVACLVFHFTKAHTSDMMRLSRAIREVVKTHLVDIAQRTEHVEEA